MGRALEAIAKHAKVDLIWVAGRSPALVPQNFEMTTLHYLAIFFVSIEILNKNGIGVAGAPPPSLVLKNFYLLIE